MGRDWSRRDLLKAGFWATAAIAAGPLLAACAKVADQKPADGTGAAAGSKGQVDKLFLHVFPGFEKTFDQYNLASLRTQYPNIKVDLEIATIAATYAKILAAQGSSSSFHVGMFNDLYVAKGASDKLFVKMDPKLAPNSAKVSTELDPPSGFGKTFGINPYGIAYNPKKVERPKSWLDLLNPKYKGRVVASDALLDMFAMLSKAKGKDPHDIEYGIGLMASAKANIGAWFNSGPQIRDMIANGEVWLAADWMGSVLQQKKAGKDIDFAIPEEGATQTSYVMQIMAGHSAAETEAAHVLADTFFSQEFTEKVVVPGWYLTPTIDGLKPPSDPLLQGYGYDFTAADAKAKLVRLDQVKLSDGLAKYKELINRSLKGA